MYLGVMSERLVMSHSFYCISDGLLIYYLPLIEVHREIEPFHDQALKYLKLYLAHDLNIYLLSLIVPSDIQFRILLGQFHELP